MDVYNILIGMPEENTPSRRSRLTEKYIIKT